jgi:hypothetical protein
LNALYEKTLAMPGITLPKINSIDYNKRRPLPPLFSKDHFMNQNKRPAFLILLACIFGTANAATIFQDNFQDSVASKANWVFPTGIQRYFTNGDLSVQNTNPNYYLNVTHNFLSKSSTFTLSAKITADSNGAGLGICATSNDGIVLWLGPGQNIYAYADTVLLFSAMNSFINATINTVKISKKDSVFNVFCNGSFISGFVCSDSKYINGGDIALAVPAKTTFTVDSVLMIDQFATGAPITSFNDNFTSGNTHGWYISNLNGTASVSSGSLTITNNDISPTAPYVNGDFNKASLRVIATHKKGVGFYGLAFYDLVPGPLGDTVKSYLFLVDSSRDYASGLPDSNSIASTQTSLVHGDKDTLEVLRFSNKYKFWINGALMPDSFPLLAPGRIDVAGLYIGGKTTVSFEEFAIGGDSTGNFTSVIQSPKGVHGNNFGPITRIMGNDFFVFDVSGRIIKHGNGNYPEILKNLPGGMYIVKSVRNNAAIPIKSFTNVK